MAASQNKRNSPTEIRHGNKPVHGSGKKVKAKQQQERNLTFIERMDRFMEPRLTLVLYVSLFFTFFFGAFLFDVKISTGGDDSSYIEMAHNFIKGVSFPTFHGPLYSLFLCLPMLILGVNVIILKLISFAFILAHHIFFFHTFKRLFSPALFSLVMLIVSVSSTILYFASQTYSEAMYMFLQAAVIYAFIGIFTALTRGEEVTLRHRIRYWIGVGFLALVISLTRDIGIVLLASMLLFLLLQKKYLDSLLLSLSFLLFFIPYKLYKALAWDSVDSSRTSNLSQILLKNHYNQAEGYENFGGMVARFFENARLYLSKHFMIGIGLHDPASTDKSWFVTLIIAFLLIMALVYAIKRDKIMLFIGVYLGAALAATFIALQTSWDQMRMVVIYIPLMLVVISWGIMQLSSRKGYGFLQVVLVGLLVLVFFRTLGQTLGKTAENREVLVQNLKGNMYYGFTPDWQNYLRMSEWAGQNVPEDVGIAARKPSMSFIYSKGRDFYGIYRLPTEDPATMIGRLDEAGDGGLVAVSGLDIQHLPLAEQMRIKSNVLAFVADGEVLYGIYSDTDPFRDLLTEILAQPDFRAMPVDSLLDVLDDPGKSPYAVSPDEMLLDLREHQVGYVIMASLRAIPAEKTGRTINTVQRYLYFIQQKYAGIFTLEQQIGADNEEPAWLYRINYDDNAIR